MMLFIIIGLFICIMFFVIMDNVSDAEYKINSFKEMLDVDIRIILHQDEMPTKKEELDNLSKETKDRLINLFLNASGSYKKAIKFNKRSNEFDSNVEFTTFESHEEYDYLGKISKNSCYFLSENGVVYHKDDVTKWRYTK